MTARLTQANLIIFGAFLSYYILTLEGTVTESNQIGLVKSTSPILDGRGRIQNDGKIKVNYLNYALYFEWKYCIPSTQISFQAKSHSR